MRKFRKIGGQARRFLEKTGKVVSRHALGARCKISKLLSSKNKMLKKEGKVVCSESKPVKKTDDDDIDTWGDEGGSTLSERE